MSSNALLTGYEHESQHGLIAIMYAAWNETPADDSYRACQVRTKSLLHTSYIIRCNIIIIIIIRFVKRQNVKRLPWR